MGTKGASGFASLTKSVLSWLLILFAFMLPIHNQTVAIITLALVFIWTINFFVTPWHEILNEWKRQYALLSFTGLFILYLLGLFTTSNINEGLMSLQIKLPLLFFPLFFATTGFFRISERQWNRILKAFISGCLMTTLFFFFHALYRYTGTHDVKEFYYLRLLYLHHPSYLAMYLNFCIVLILYLIFDQRFMKVGRHIPFILVLVWFHIYLFLLSSKAGILGLACIIILSSLYIITVKRRILPGTVLLIGWGVLFWISVNFFRFPLERIRELGESYESSQVVDPDTRSSSESRILIWKASLEILKEKWLAGAGTGDVKDELVSKYGQSQFSYGITKRLNAHNQWIETFLATGVNGFIILFSLIVIPWIQCIKRKEWLYPGFLFLVGLNFCFESMLERQAGVMFYAFFNAMLYKKLSDS